MFHAPAIRSGLEDHDVENIIDTAEHALRFHRRCPKLGRRRTRHREARDLVSGNSQYQGVGVGVWPMHHSRGALSNVRHAERSQS